MVFFTPTGIHIGPGICTKPAGFVEVLGRILRPLSSFSRSETGANSDGHVTAIEGLHFLVVLNPLWLEIERSTTFGFGTALDVVDADGIGMFGPKGVIDSDVLESALMFSPVVLVD